MDFKIKYRRTDVFQAILEPAHGIFRPQNSERLRLGVSIEEMISCTIFWAKMSRALLQSLAEAPTPRLGEMRCARHHPGCCLR
jgi:hypothetical protein